MKTDLKLFTGKVTKTFIFNVQVRAASHEDATSYIMDLDEHDFNETPYLHGTVASVKFEDGTAVRIIMPNEKPVMNFGLLGEAMETANA